MMTTGNDETMAEKTTSVIAEPGGEILGHAADRAQVVTAIAPAKMTLTEVRERLDGKTGRRFWKNLDELAETPAFQELMQEEFPRQASGVSEWVDPVSRRGFMKVMGASLALAGMAGCTKQPDEPIYPYIRQPEDLVLGKPMFFATAHPFPTGAIPVLVKSDAFRPIKLEGNPEHSVSKGRLDAITQATLLDLYDPDRSQHCLNRGANTEWSYFKQTFGDAVKKTGKGQGIYFLSETITSPTLAEQWKQVQAAYPQAKLVQWEPVNQDSSRAASKAAFGEYVDAQYKLENADVILSLDADFLGGIQHPGFLPLAAAYAERHRFDKDKQMNRLYVIETMPTVTGFKAEHRLALKPSDLEAVASALSGAAPQGRWTPDQDAFGKALMKDLQASHGRVVVIPGEQASPAVHAAAYALNQTYGAVGSTVVYTQTVNPIPSEQMADFKALVGDMNAGKVEWLVMLGVNPIYSAPADANFQEAFNKVPNTVHLGTHVDETGSISTWHVNKAHYLEIWSDARAYDGSLTIIQPMIDPMYGGRTSHNVLQALLADPDASAFDAVQANARTVIKGDAAQGWRKALHDGWVEGTAFTPRGGGGARTTAPTSGLSSPAGGAPDMFEVLFRPDSSIYDGRYANVGWLQEVPKQVTSMSWDNAALMSLGTIERLKLDENDIVTIEVDGRKVLAPVLMVPGHPDGVVTLHLGFGRQASGGRVAAGVGFNAYQVRTSSAPLYATGAKITKAEGRWDLCVTKVHNIEHRGRFAQHDLENPLSDKEGTYSLAGHEAMERSIIRYATVSEAKAHPDFAHEGAGKTTLVNKVGYMPQGDSPTKDDQLSTGDWVYNHIDESSKKIQNAWGMSIDLNSCIGCNACIVACYAENNIAVVGREQVKVGRNMQWIRIDTYFEGDLHAPKAHFQPMACQHCENAGCELVCPVGATVHTPEGLNTMVYNRCVGTRYCSNNCAYKVRRFNFLLYADYDTESLKFMRNPDVTVRSRGVMEKCTYCVQRIEEAKITADKENRAVRDGEIVTACQQSCPTDAIVFGNVNDPASKVGRRKAEEREYQVLADLNYRPRTTYTAGVINPNPEMELA